MSDNVMFDRGLFVEKTLCENGLKKLKELFPWIESGTYIAGTKAKNFVDGEMMFHLSFDGGKTPPIKTFGYFDVKHSIDHTPHTVNNGYSITYDCYNKLMSSRDPIIFFCSDEDKCVHVVDVRKLIDGGPSQFEGNIKLIGMEHAIIDYKVFCVEPTHEKSV